MQRLWILNVDWDENPPQEIAQLWRRYLEQLPLLESLKIPRCISVKKLQSCELHGFSDSSESGPSLRQRRGCGHVQSILRYIKYGFILLQHLFH